MSASALKDKYDVAVKQLEDRDETIQRMEDHLRKMCSVVLDGFKEGDDRRALAASILIDEGLGDGIIKTPDTAKFVERVVILPDGSGVKIWQRRLY